MPTYSGKDIKLTIDCSLSQQAVGASFRMFELMDRVPAISVEGGRTLSSVNQSMA